MRPKASRENLHIAASFASAITIQRNDSRIVSSNDCVECKGPASIYAALQFGLPDIVRDAENSGGRKRNTVSEAELVKFLCRSGYIRYRYRPRVRGTINEWSAGSQRWKNIRWVDTRNSGDMRHMDERLSELASKLPKTLKLDKRRLASFLSTIISDNSIDVNDPGQAMEDLASADFLALPQEIDPNTFTSFSLQGQFTPEFFLPTPHSVPSECSFLDKPGPRNLSPQEDHRSSSEYYQHVPINPLRLTQHRRRVPPQD
jgi:hypothetical protein